MIIGFLTESLENIGKQENTGFFYWKYLHLL